MKIAILGSDEAAIAAYRHFEDLGVHVKLIGQMNQESSLEGINFKDVEVVRVHKRFLAPEIDLKNRSRMADTFRVVYKVNATSEIERQKLDNPEIFEKLGKDVLDSLKNSIESFEDFDFVCYSTELTKPAPMGAARVYALNELALASDDRITYHKGHDQQLDAILETRNLCLVGTGEENLKLLGKVKESFLSDLRKTIQIVTSEEIPFSNIDISNLKEEVVNFQSLLAEDRKQFEAEIAQFEGAIRDWRALEPHIKAKTPQPPQPVTRLMIYNSAIVSSVDKLLDRKGLFVTIEGSDLLGGGEQLKTLSCDRICVDQGLELATEKLKGLRSDEEGLYSLNSMTLDEIEKDMLKYFSKQ